MTLKTAAALCVLSLAAVAAEPTARVPDDVKQLTPGLWEGTVESEWIRPPLDRAQMHLEQLAPDARARVEAVLKKQEDEAKARNGAPETSKHTKKFCVNPAWIAKQDGDLDGSGPGAECKRTVVSRSKSKLELKSDCTNPHGHFVDQLTLETRSPHDYQATKRTEGEIDGKPTRSATTLTAKWLAADCGSVK